MRRLCAARNPAAPGPSSDESLYTSQDAAQVWLGPVQPFRAVGTGRGLEASRTLAAGDLIIISEPLAVVEQAPAESQDSGASGDRSGEASARRRGSGGAGGGEEGEDEEEDEEEEEGEDEDEEAQGVGEGAAYVPTDADVDALVGQLQGAGSAPRVAAWLSALDDGSPDRSSQLPDIRQLSSLPPTTSTDPPATPPTAAAAAGGASAAPAAGTPFDADLLADVIALNYISCREDPSVAALLGSGRPPRDLVGLWPEAALINHSCAPNTSLVAMEGRLLVRAARPVGKQVELTRSYLAGPQLLAPLGQRQRALKETHGFVCKCPRCRDEGRQDPNLQQLVADVADACGALEADLTDAVLSGRERAVGSIRDQLAAFIEVVDAAFNKLALQQRSQTYMQASLFRLYELAAVATAATGEDQPRLVELLSALAGEVAPGSEEHVYWARRYRHLIEETEGEDGNMDGALRYADQACQAATSARYGQLPRPLYRRLLRAADEVEAGIAGELED